MSLPCLFPVATWKVRNGISRESVYMLLSDMSVIDVLDPDNVFIK